MKKINLLTLLIFSFQFLLPHEVNAESLRRDHLSVQLVSANHNFTDTSHDTFQIGVHFKIDPEWHVYWKNPGDSGASPKFNFTGATLKEVSWPYPVRLPLGDLTNYGYEHEVVIPLTIQATANEIKLNLEWLVCKVECVPGFAEIILSNKTVDNDPVAIETFQKRIPLENKDYISKFLSRSESFLNFEMKSSKEAISQIKSLFVFPENGEAFLTGLPKVKPIDDYLKISVPLSSNAVFNSKTEAFTFVLHKIDGSVISFTENISVQKDPPSLWLGILLAFVGGMILNLMPCVFPVLFLKAFSFLKEENVSAIRRSSWHYAWGVIVSFLVFGGLLTALRISGEAVGWGYQLQNAWVVYLLSLLFFAMALNFYGFFEIGDSLMMRAGKLGSSQFLSGSFGTGVLAVVVASPCTAPFMGSALGLALLLPAHLSILIFLSLGLGMALPMVVLAYVPKLIEKIPRSGQWMIVVKQFMSFPLFATGLWLLWVLGNQKGSEAIFIALLSFLTFVMGLWILNIAKRKFFKILAFVLLVGSPLQAIYFIREVSLPNAAQTTDTKSLWTPYDEKVIADKKLTQAIFIDFTASWCITCQVNKKTVLHTDEIQQLFKEHNVLLMQADWTNQDPIITKALARFDRNSVPLYVFYNKMSEASVLPELLTKDTIRNLFLKTNEQTK